MVASMSHHGGLRSGKYCDPAAGFWIGWMEHTGAFAEAKPLQCHGENSLLFFTGEHFPETGDMAGFLRDGVLAADAAGGGLAGLYEGSVEGFLRKLNGWFAGVLFRADRREIAIFTDRFAISRMYVYEGEEEVLFASEAKAILKVRPKLRQIDLESMADQFRYNCVLGNRTLFRGLRFIPGGEVWTAEAGAISRKASFFDYSEWEHQTPLDPKAFFEEWCGVVSERFGAYANRGSDVALSLTAGLDTRLILAALKEGCRNHPAYTFGGAWGELYDVSIARRAALVYQQKFDVIPIDDGFLKGFPDYARRAVHLSDGTYEACGAHDVFFNEKAMRIAPYRLTGKFGSEIIRVRRMMPTLSYDRGLLAGELERMVDERPHYHRSDAGGHPLTRVIREEIGWHEYSRMSLEQIFLTMRTPYMDNRLVSLMYRAPAGTRETGDLQEDYVKRFAPEFGAFVTNLGRFASRNSFVTKMAYYPFWALFKVEYTYLYATPHWMTRLDTLFSGLHLERIFGGRQKWEGYRLWLRDEWGGFVKDTLLNPNAAYTNYLDFGAVAGMVNQHVAGTHNHLQTINRALTVQLLHETLIDESKA